MSVPSPEFLEILKDEEGLTIDFKESLELKGEEAKHELAKDVSCMANARGGTLVIGVRDKPRVVVGIPSLLPREQIAEIVNRRTSPRVQIAVKTYNINGILVGAIQVAMGKLPHEVLPEHGLVPYL